MQDWPSLFKARSDTVNTLKLNAAIDLWVAEERTIGSTNRQMKRRTMRAIMLLAGTGPRRAESIYRTYQQVRKAKIGARMAGVELGHPKREREFELSVMLRAWARRRASRFPIRLLPTSHFYCDSVVDAYQSANTRERLAVCRRQPNHNFLTTEE